MKTNNMKTRNIKLDLKTAKQWFEGNDETLKKLALQAFTEEELSDNLPNTWYEFCAEHNVSEVEYYIGISSDLRPTSNKGPRHPVADRNLLSSRKSAEAHLALMQLERLRDCYRNGWIPNWKDDETAKYVILANYDELDKGIKYHVNFFLAFQTKELRDKFFDNFRDLIEIVKDLI